MVAERATTMAFEQRLVPLEAVVGEVKSAQEGINASITKLADMQALVNKDIKDRMN